MRIVVFGGGMQGRVIANNLAARPEKPEVVVADFRKAVELPAGLIEAQVDVLDREQVTAAVKGAAAAVLAVPSNIAHAALENIIRAGVPVADVSFTPEPPLSLNALAKSTGAACIVDCGVAPGLSHILVGSSYAELGGLDNVRILVGGMPQQPPAVFRHAIYFNPCDLLAEYTRPARARSAGKDIAPPPMETALDTYKDCELGLLESFLSDGLRTLLTSYPDVPQMSERTLRWQGHCDTMRSLYEIGLLDERSVESTAMTFAARYPAEKYPDMLLMVVEAQRDGTSKCWRLLDRQQSGQSAMSRTTGYTTAAVAMVLARGQFTEPGVHPPEVLGKDPALAKVIVDDLSAHGLSIELTEGNIREKVGVLA
jgi:saccharopine dehydrogenase-like NADP-dependent oxidoreductase